MPPAEAYNDGKNSAPGEERKRARHALMSPQLASKMASGIQLGLKTFLNTECFQKASSP